MATKRTIAEMLEESAGGQLRAKSAPTAAQTAAAAGQAAAPSTPLGTAGLPGATPDQAKMAGTPNQLQSAVGASAPFDPEARSVARADAPTPTVAAAVDKGGVGGGVVPGEAEAKRKVETERLRTAYGDVGMRVDRLIQSAIPAAGAAPATPKFSVGDLSALEGLETKGAAAQNVTTALQSLAESPDDPARYAAAQRALKDAGYTNDPRTLLTQADVGDAAAQSAGEVKLTPDVLEKLGVQAGELEMLGLDPADAANLTVAQLQDRIDAALAQEEDRLAQLKREAADPNTPANVRAAARDELARAGGTGVTSAAAGASALRDEIAEGGRITVAGRELSVEEFLDDENLPGLVKQYLESPETRKQLDEQLGPEFGAFVRNHADFLAEATKTLDAAATTATGVQGENAALMQQLEAAGVDPAVFTQLAKDVFPEMGDEFSLSKIDPSKSGVLQLLLGQSALPEGVTPSVMMERISALGKTDPAVAREILELSPEEIERAGIFYSPEKFASYTQAIQERREFDADPQGYIQKLFGGNGPADEWAAALAADALGNSKPRRRLAQILDVDGDGRLDDADTIAQSASEFTNTPSIAALVDNGGKGWRTNRDLVDGVEKPSELTAAIAPLIADGGLGARDIVKISNMSGMTTEQLKQLSNSPYLGQSGTKKLAEEIDRHIRNDTIAFAVDQLAEGGLGGTWRAVLESGEIPAEYIKPAKLLKFAEYARARAKEAKKRGLNADYLLDLAAKADAKRSGYASESVTTKEAAPEAKGEKGKAGKKPGSDKLPIAPGGIPNPLLPVVQPVGDALAQTGQGLADGTGNLGTALYTATGLPNPKKKPWEK